MQAYDLEGSARVAAEIDTPIASGETEYGRYGFRDMLERKSADVLMPDLERVGGVTEWVRVAHMAAAYDVPVSPHIFSEHSLQLCGAISNVNYAEHMPWFAELFQERLEMVNGDLLIPEGASERTLAELDRKGVKVEVIQFDKVHLNGGGLHCSTTQLYRDPV